MCTEFNEQGHPDDAPFGTLYRSVFWLALIESASVQFELMKMQILQTVYLFCIIKKKTSKKAVVAAHRMFASF